ncbi:MAG: histidine phosphatase family protein [Acidimicrobiales bacterium]
MTSPTVLFLVRHGRTALNADGRLRGRLDPPLDEAGLAEVGALGRAFAGFSAAGAGAVTVGAVVSSPLVRALQTASRIATACGVSIEIDDRLADRDYGEWAGERPGELVRRFGSVDAAPGVEPYDSLAARATAAVTALLAGLGESAGVLVAHDAVNRAILSRLVPALGPPEGIRQRTGCWNRLELAGGQWSAPVVDALAHQRAP